MEETAKFLHEAKMLAFSQAKYQAKRGMKPTEYLVAVTKYSVEIQRLRFEAAGISVIEYAIETYDCCDACSKFQSRTFTFEEIEKNSILPVKECTYRFDKNLKSEWCTCAYWAVT